MVRNIHLVYKDGVFHTLEPVEIPEGTTTTITMDQLEAPAPELSPGQRAYLAIKAIADLPIQGPREGFSGRDHDKILYGND